MGAKNSDHPRAFHLSRRLGGTAGQPSRAGLVLITLVAALSLLPVISIFFSQQTTVASLFALPSGFAAYILRVTAQTMLMCAAVIAVSLAVGIPAGYFLARIPARQALVFTLLATIPLASPSMVSAIVIRNLFERSGWLYKALLALNIRLPSAYGLTGLVLALLVHSIPYTMLIARSGFLLIPRELEETACSLGARHGKVFATVLLPSIKPHVLTASLMVLIYTLGDLGAPLIVGGGYKVFASEIYTNFISNWGDKRIPMVFALWTVLIFSAILVLLVQLKQARLARPAQSSGIAAGAFLSAQVRRVGSVLMSLLTLVLLLPFINLLVATGLQSLLHPAAQGARAFPIHDFRPVWTTFLLALFSVPPMIAGGILIAHSFKSLRHKGLAMSVMLAPAVLPGVLLGFGLLQSFYAINQTTNATPLLVVILVLALTLRGLPYVIIVLQSAINSSNIPLEDSARSLGAPSLQAFLSVTLPQIRPVLGVAAVVGLFSCVTELAASLVIYPPGWQTMSMYIAYYMEEGLVSRALAMSLLLLGVVEATLALASRALQRADRRQAGLAVAHPLFEAPQAHVAETGAVQPSVFLSAFTAVQPEPEAERRGNVRAGGSVIERLVRRGRAFAAGLKNRRGGGMRSGGFGRSSRSALDALQAENLDLRRKLALAEQKSLRMQINPHFFFNTLNTIVSLLRLDPAAAAETIGKLSSLFRYTLDASEEQAMFLPKEIEYIRTYLEIEKLRFGDALVFSIDVPDELYSLQVPPMLVQPLVENAVKYGKNADGIAYVHLAARREGDFLVLEVADYGVFQGDPEDLRSQEGTGIKNIRSRLAALGAGSLVLLRNKPSGVVAKLMLRVEE